MLVTDKIRFRRKWQKSRESRISAILAGFLPCRPYGKKTRLYLFLAPRKSR